MRIGRLMIFCLLAFVLVASPSCSCKKAVEDQYSDILTKLMTDGSWIITKFVEGGVDITASFNGSVCKFYDNHTMTATQGSTVINGTWQSDINAQTISAEYPASAGNPYIKVNGTWNITSTSATVGKFSQTKAGVAYIMELTKY